MFRLVYIFYSHISHICMVIIYTVTELCAHALCGEFDGETVCIGYPASNVRAYIMNPANGKEAPLNVAGELWVSGRNVSKGYLNRPDLTEKHFTLDQESGLRCYKTGDLAKVCMI